MKNLVWFAGIAALITAMFWHHSPPVTAQSNASSARIAVIDLDVILEGSARRATLEGEIEADFRQRLETIEGLEKEMRKMSGELQLLNEGAPEFNEKARLMKQKEAELKFYQELFTKELEKKKAESFGALLAEIRRVVDDHAQSRGFDLVLQKQLTLQQGMPAWESVIYARDGFDISSEIISLLNGK